MIRRFRRTFSFDALESAFGDGSFLSKRDKLAINKRLVSSARQRMTKGTIQPPLRQSTVEIRNWKDNGAAGTKNPLLNTGELYNSLTPTDRGIQMHSYGWQHQNGYYQPQNRKFMKPFNIPANDIPARPFIPVDEAIALGRNTMKHIIKTMEKIMQSKPYKG